jgi:hypothetical protein
VNLTVRYHGIVGDMLRRKTQQVAIPDGATVTDLLAEITDGADNPQADAGLHRWPASRPRRAPRRRRRSDVHAPHRRRITEGESLRCS